MSARRRWGGGALSQTPVAAAASSSGDPIVTTQWLADHLEDVALLDVRGRVETAEVAPGVEKSEYLSGYDSYLEGHIPGAVFFDWTRDGVDASQEAPAQLDMDADRFHAMLEGKGVSSDRPVVVYDSGDGMFAARLWWALTVHGHPCPLVLEGGWARWRAEGRASELYEPCTLKVSTYFDAANATPAPWARVTAGQLREMIKAPPAGGPVGRQAGSGSRGEGQGGSSGGSSGAGQGAGGGGSGALGDVIIVDTRSAEQYTGQVRRGPRGGRVPGAVHLARRELTDPATGWLLPLDCQRAVLEERLGLREGELARGNAGAGGEGGGGGGGGGGQGAAAQRRVVLYCNGGVAACTAALALHRLGHRNWAVYDGSWNEWGAREDLPVEAGGGGGGGSDGGGM